MTYTYDPSMIGTASVSRMRFELGDTAVAGGADTAYLSDEEINGMLAAHPTFNRAKIALVEAVYMRLSYEVTTRVGPLSLDLQARADHWKKLLDDLKGALPSAPKAPAYIASANGKDGNAPYFYSGMHDNLSAGEER